MTDKLNEALNNVEEVYFDLNEVAASCVKDYVTELDLLVAKLSKGIDLYSNNDLRDLMLRISVEAYVLGNIKEKSSLKEACAEALFKEKQARTFTSATGAVEARKNQSIIESSDTQAVAMLYASVAGILKTKCDEAHRLVSVISNILISRAADAKNQNNPRSEIDQMNMLNENNMQWRDNK